MKKLIFNILFILVAGSISGIVSVFVEKLFGNVTNVFIINGMRGGVIVAIIFLCLFLYNAILKIFNWLEKEQHSHGGKIGLDGLVGFAVWGRTEISYWYSMF